MTIFDPYVNIHQIFLIIRKLDFEVSVYLLRLFRTQVCSSVLQVEEMEEGEQTKPPGFHVIYYLYLI